MRTAVAGKARATLASARKGNRLFQPPLHGQCAESDDRPRLLGDLSWPLRECTAIDVSIADMVQRIAKRSAPPVSGVRQREWRATGGCAGQPCVERSRARQRFPWNSNADRRAGGNPAGRQSVSRRAGRPDPPIHFPPIIVRQAVRILQCYPHPAQHGATPEQRIFEAFRSFAKISPQFQQISAELSEQRLTLVSGRPIKSELSADPRSQEDGRK